MDRRYDLEELLDTIIQNYQIMNNIMNANVELINGFKNYVAENKTD
jgi:hypothetical protein